MDMDHLLVYLVLTAVFCLFTVLGIVVIMISKQLFFVEGDKCLGGLALLSWALIIGAVLVMFKSLRPLLLTQDAFIVYVVCQIVALFIWHSVEERLLRLCP